MSVYESVDGYMRYLFGIYDGHSTGAASHFCQQELFGFIERRLHMLDRARQRHLNGVKDQRQRESFEAMFIEKRQVLVEQALISAFIDADKHYITESILSHLLNGDGAERCISGSCVVVSFIENGYLYVANTGDCRAILGTLVSEDKFEAIELSADQNTDSESEIKRIQANHPQDPRVITNGRVKGILRPTRNIGGALLKEEIAKEFVAPGCLNEPWQPPYTTASPEVSIRKIELSDRFIVLASDGLWDLLSSQDVVDIVVEYQLRKASNALHQDFQGDVATFLISKALERVPLIVNNAPEDAQLEKISYLLRLPDSYKRSVYDDITVIIVFIDPADEKTHVEAHSTHSKPSLTLSQNNRNSKPPFPQSIERVERFKTLFGHAGSSRATTGSINKTSVVEKYLQKCWPTTSASWTSKNLSTTDLFVSLGISSSPSGSLSSSSE